MRRVCMLYVVCGDVVRLLGCDVVIVWLESCFDEGPNGNLHDWFVN